MTALRLQIPPVPSIQLKPIASATQQAMNKSADRVEVGRDLNISVNDTKAKFLCVGVDLICRFQAPGLPDHQAPRPDPVASEPPVNTDAPAELPAKMLPIPAPTISPSALAPVQPSPIATPVTVSTAHPSPTIAPTPLATARPSPTATPMPLPSPTPDPTIQIQVAPALARVSESFTFSATGLTPHAEISASIYAHDGLKGVRFLTADDNGQLHLSLSGQDPALKDRLHFTLKLRDSQTGLSSEAIAFDLLPPPINLIAGQIPVIISNGAEDPFDGDGDVIQNGLYPAAVTDGRLGFQGQFANSPDLIAWSNIDYDQELSVSLSFILPAPTRLTQIRYHQGSVQRAATWIPNQIQTPCGLMHPLPGTNGVGAGSEGQGVWTSIACQSDAKVQEVTVIFSKTRISYSTDWMVIGELEIYGD